ncbi:hypothetical protein BDA96_05G095700 [Sorghum bicolor]|uniref:Uncharacterized protein n=1 Tax=Sorghum bicolor TaxID=4558 RepID=A0A921UEU6_SORBI|nr:hypothetical protein BDA96_05G095700 [Sorghum bicolor]
MADSSPAPGYYSGPPAVTHKASPSEPVDGQVNASLPGGYYSGGPAAKHGAGGGQGSSAAPKESGFFASCCACFSGGETAR